MKRDRNEVFALGRTMHIGDLYDMTEDKVVMQGLNAFKYNKPKWTENSHTEHKTTIEKKDSDKYDLIGIDPELKLTLGLGFFELNGSAKYLKTKK
jgi:hypothetical protein